MIATLKRRELITLFGGAAAWPLAARAQHAAKLPTIGYLGGGASINQRAWAEHMASLSAQSRSALTLFASPLVARSGAHRKFL